MDLLIDADELAHLLAQPRLPILIDTRSAAAYAQSHLPGAYNVNGWDLLPDDTTMSGLFEFNQELDHRFRVLGRFEKVHVVVYGDGLDRISAHTFWLMHYAGQLATRLFYPGFDAWVAKGGAVTSDLPVIDPCPFAVRVRREVIGRYDELTTIVQSGGAPLFDVRDPEEQAAGTIPGALPFELGRLFTADGLAFRTPEEMTEVFTSLGLDRRSEAIFISNQGARSGLAWLATRLVGFRKCRSFLGGMREWNARSGV